ncbi:helix-turn-helix domain-containing protein [Maribacter dokdonensis]|uniref:helix-turn-helix domain-containing protein n=1 Tax=Maribacter dokdonensis TaxID=320912 RepID=UPI002734797A|nr:helix-turn-helix domain-containing protein [Maribacter dokdonensis]MDP2525637.1 helix-turn-helix domain-containing protein [Maribacter dokdonensis]
MKKENITLYSFNPEEFKLELLSEVQALLIKTLKQKGPEDQPVYITRKEAAKLLNVSLVTIHEWSKRKILSPKKIGTRIRFKLTDIQEILEN